MRNMNEIWHPINGYNGVYECSNTGLIRRINKNGYRIIKPVEDRDGYLYLNLCMNSKFKTFRVHRLVAESFILNVGNKKHINHKDGDKSNNSVQNLEWVTPSENMKHSYAVLGRQAPMHMKGRFGSLHHSSRKVDQFSLNWEYIKTFESVSDIYRELTKSGRPSGSIQRIMKTQKPYKGYYFKYKS